MTAKQEDISLMKVTLEPTNHDVDMCATQNTQTQGKHERQETEGYCVSQASVSMKQQVRASRTRFRKKSRKLSSRQNSEANAHSRVQRAQLQ